MLSIKDSAQKYIRIKEQKQKKYDNNITIIIYNEIKSHCESSSCNRPPLAYRISTSSSTTRCLTTYTAGTPTSQPISSLTTALLSCRLTTKGETISTTLAF